MPRYKTFKGVYIPKLRSFIVGNKEGCLLYIKVDFN